jgi:ABC-type antimicrobial peptide transport system permease subunit
VAFASVSSVTPFFNWPDTRKYVIEGRALPERGHEPVAVVNDVTPGYFQTFGTRLVAGRTFDDRDRLDSPKVFIIGQSMAKGLFGNESPIGHRLAQVTTTNAQWGEIVGVAADVKSVLPEPPAVSYQLYQPMAQEPLAYSEIAVRTTAAISPAMIADIRSTITALDPDLAVRDLQSADARIDRANYQSAVLRDMLTGFALLGLALASLGIYGVIARTMAQRAGEFAIRFALGACIRDIRRIVLASGLKLALVGATLGLVGALGIARLLAASNPGMQLNSPEILLGTTALLIAVALVASWLPARRAARINPIDALRAE